MCLAAASTRSGSNRVWVAKVETSTPASRARRHAEASRSFEYGSVSDSNVCGADGEAARVTNPRSWSRRRAAAPRRVSAAARTIRVIPQELKRRGSTSSGLPRTTNNLESIRRSASSRSCVRKATWEWSITLYYGKSRQGGRICATCGEHGVGGAVKPNLEAFQEEAEAVGAYHLRLRKPWVYDEHCAEAARRKAVSRGQRRESSDLRRTWVHLLRVPARLQEGWVVVQAQPLAKPVEGNRHFGWAERKSGWAISNLAYPCYQRGASRAMARHSHAFQPPTLGRESKQQRPNNALPLSIP